MQKVGKHAWGTPKCGISLVKNTWANIAKDIDYVFLLARNPYNRLVSIYTEKVVDVNGRYAEQYQVDLQDFIARSNLMMTPARKFTNMSKIDIPVIHMSFKDFVMAMDREWLFRQDEHVTYQTVGAPDFKFDDILFLEDLPKCFEIPRDKLGIELDCSEENLKQLGGTDRGDSHATPRKKGLNLLGNAYGLPGIFWWAAEAVPEDYSVMYDEEMRDHVYDLYREDFEYFGLTK
jgi:hypothetical protein